MTQPDIKALEEAIESAWQNTDIGGEPCLSFGNEKQREDFEQAARAHLQSLKAGNDVIKQDIPAGDYICDLHVIETGGEKQWFLDGIRTDKPLTVQELEGMKRPLRANYGYDDHGLGYDSGHNDAIDKVIGRVKGE